MSRFEAAPVSSLFDELVVRAASSSFVTIMRLPRASSTDMTDNRTIENACHGERLLFCVSFRGRIA